jgi:hypothetical protein
MVEKKRKEKGAIADQSPKYPKYDHPQLSHLLPPLRVK